METKSGKISVTTENIFPVIRQWLYEDKDIFVRELVSNCADAIAKHRRLVELGKAEKEPDKSDYKITVTYDDDKDRKSTRLNSSHIATSRMPSSA